MPCSGVLDMSILESQKFMRVEMSSSLPVTNESKGGYIVTYLRWSVPALYIGTNVMS